APNPFFFLIDDGEEAGLLGAEAFASQHPWAGEVGVVINLEARGSSGASLLFETSDDNRWLIRIAGEALARPNTSSIFSTIYKYLPNDTDLTVFREHGLAGVNFACIGDVAHYHTPLDNIENGSPATLQHHGQNALAMARALGRADLAAPHRGNAVFFDLFGAAIVSGPEEAALPLAAIALLLVLASIGRHRRRHDLLIGEAGWGFVASLAMLFAPVLLALVAVRLLRAFGALPTQWVAHPQWLVAMLWVAAALGAGIGAQMFARRAGFWGMWSGVWVLWAFSSLALAWVAPGLAFVFLVPALAAGLCGWSREPWSATVPALVASFFWLPMAWFLYDGLGDKAAALIAVMVALPASTLAPLFSRLSPTPRRGVLWALAGGVGIFFVASALSPFSSMDSPERMPIAWHEDADSGVASWLVMPESGRLPPAMKNAAPFVPASIGGFPWAPAAGAFRAEGARVDTPPPELVGRDDRREGSARRLSGTIRSPRGAPILFLAFLSPTLPDSVRIAGRKLPPLYARAARQMSRWRVYSCLDVPPEGVSVEIFFAAGRSFEFVLGDQSYGLPSGGERFASARPPTSVTSQAGDVTIVTRRMRF
ncbi:MAG TPA: M28 family peptidase, partial [Thermoanaerobaculia bacterium]